MATFKYEPRSYEDAELVYRGARNRRVVLGHQTELHRGYGYYYITLFGNEVVRFNRDGSKEFKTCGWITASTIDRLSAFSPDKFLINGKNYTRRAKQAGDAHLILTDRITGEVNQFVSRFVLNANDSLVEVL